MPDIHEYTGKDAVTTKEIKGVTCETIPVGTKFQILAILEDCFHATCTGLPIGSVWCDEFDFVDGSPKKHGVYCPQLQDVH